MYRCECDQRTHASIRARNIAAAVAYVAVAIVVLHGATILF